MSNTSLSKTEQDANVLLVRILLDESIDKVLAEFMSMCSEGNGDEIFHTLSEMVEQGKSKFNEYVVELKRRSTRPFMIEGRESEYENLALQWQKSSIPRLTEMLTKLETTSMEISLVWPYAAWVPKQATWLLMEELDLRVKALQISWSLKMIERKKQVPVAVGLLNGTTGFYDNTTQYIPDEAPPKWLQSVYNKQQSGEELKPENISSIEELFKDVSDIDKCIDVLRLIRREKPIISKTRRWQRRSGAIGILSAWICWLEDCKKIHTIRPITNLIPVLERTFSDLKIGKSGRTLKGPDNDLVLEFTYFKIP